MIRIPSLVALLAWSLLSVPSLAAEDEPAKKVDARAEKVLRAVAEHLQGLKTITARIESTLSVKAVVGGNNMTSVFSFALEQPNRLAVVLKEGDMGATVVSDGKQLSTYVPQLKKYSVEDAPKTLAEITSGPRTMAHLAHALSFMGFFTLFQPRDELLKNVDSLDYLGEDKLDERSVHHIKLSMGSSSWEFWIEKEGAPWVRKLVPDIAKALAKSGQELPAGVTFSLSATFNDWKANPELAGDAFHFTAPTSAEKVNSLFGPSRPEIHPLVGKDAPKFELESAAGKPVKLADLIEKRQVIILDFWATWCGPCVKALPTIADVAKEYKAKGVAFYAVNVGEDAPTVNDFLKEQELDVPVLLDVESKVGELYQASAIPQTVLIGKDGSVQVVHVGLSSDLRKRLTKELDDLLAGKDLASETLKENSGKSKTAEEKPAEEKTEK